MPPIASQTLVQCSAPWIQSMSGMPPVAMITTSGASARTSALPHSIEPDLDAEPLELRAPPVDDAEQVLAPAGARGEQQLPAEPVGGLEQHDVVPALRAHARGLEPGRAAADHDDLAARSRGDASIACGRVVSRARSRDCAGSAGGIATGNGWRRRRGGCVLVAGLDLAHDMRVGDVGARHRHHVEQALADGVAGGGDIGNAGGMETPAVSRRA